MKRLFSVLLFLLAGSAARAQSTLTQEEALRLAFPAPLRVERRTAYLEDVQLARAQQLAGKTAPVTQRVVTYYVGLRGTTPVGAAYFDAHRVRTLNEVLMIVIGPGAAVQRVEILKFMEPHDYRATPRWLDQFEGQQLTPDLSVKRGIANMTGATLTSNAITNAVRRSLALHSVIAPFGAEK